MTPFFSCRSPSSSPSPFANHSPLQLPHTPPPTTSTGPTHRLQWQQALLFGQPSAAASVSAGQRRRLALATIWTPPAWRPPSARTGLLRALEGLAKLTLMALAMGIGVSKCGWARRPRAVQAQPDSSSSPFPPPLSAPPLHHHSGLHLTTNNDDYQAAGVLLVFGQRVKMALDRACAPQCLTSPHLSLSPPPHQPPAPRPDAHRPTKTTICEWPWRGCGQAAGAVCVKSSVCLRQRPRRPRRARRAWP